MTTEATAIADLARQAAPATMELVDDNLDSALFVIDAPRGHEVALVDVEAMLDQPRRPRGTVVVYDAAGFVQAVRQRLGIGELNVTTLGLYADEDRKALVAILNDDEHTQGAGWRDERVELGLRERPEWKLWKGNNGKLLDQPVFAEHIESGLRELVSPDQATALDLVQTFNASVDIKVKSGTRLNNGTVQLVYDEAIDATMGKGADLAVPDELILRIAPYYGSETYDMRARFRFQVPRGGGLVKMGYELDRPDEHERAAFGDVRDVVLAELAVTAINGQAPPATNPLTIGHGVTYATVVDRNE
jgi:uncharacterized protein YfdQ (DUF2303 family)